MKGLSLIKSVVFFIFKIKTLLFLKNNLELKKMHHKFKINWLNLAPRNSRGAEFLGAKFCQL